MPTSCSIGQALSGCAFERFQGASFVINAKLGTIAVPEIELIQVPLQMLGLAVLVGSDHAALEKTERAFDSVGLCVAAYPFVLSVVDGRMTGNPLLYAEESADLSVRRCALGET